MTYIRSIWLENRSIIMSGSAMCYKHTTKIKDDLNLYIYNIRILKNNLASLLFYKGKKPTNSVTEKLLFI